MKTNKAKMLKTINFDGLIVEAGQTVIISCNHFNDGAYITHQHVLTFKDETVCSLKEALENGYIKTLKKYGKLYDYCTEVAYRDSLIG